MEGIGMGEQRIIFRGSSNKMDILFIWLCLGVSCIIAMMTFRSSLMMATKQSNYSFNTMTLGRTNFRCSLLLNIAKLVSNQSGFTDGS